MGALLLDSSRLDPTGCLDLRNKLMTLYRRSVSRWRSDLYRIIVGEDILGIGPNALIPMAASEKVERFTAYARASVNRSFDLRSDVSGLMHKVYSRGFLAAYGEESREAIPPSSRASSLYVTQLLNDTLAVSEATLQQMVHAVSIGVTNSSKPGVIYSKVFKVLRKLTLQRLVISGQTFITQAFNHGKLDAYSELGVNEVGIRAEHMPVRPIMDARSSDREVRFRTVGDEFVCGICEDLEDKTYTINEARGVIPVHPNCRCEFVRVEA
jgi:hypothetical protein